jgi:hypothetical protein
MNHVQQFEICVSHSDVSKGSFLPRRDSRVIVRVILGISKDSSVLFVKGLLSAAWLLKVNTQRSFQTSEATQLNALRHLLEDLNLHLQNFVAMDHEV